MLQLPERKTSHERNAVMHFVQPSTSSQVMTSQTDFQQTANTSLSKAGCQQSVNGSNSDTLWKKGRYEVRSFHENVQIYLEVWGHITSWNHWDPQGGTRSDGFKKAIQTYTDLWSKNTSRNCSGLHGGTKSDSFKVPSRPTWRQNVTQLHQIILTCMEIIIKQLDNFIRLLRPT